MKKFCIVTVCMFLVFCSACSNTVKENEESQASKHEQSEESKGESLMEQNVVYSIPPYSDFSGLLEKTLPESTTPKVIDQITKVTFYELNDIMLNVEVAVDLGNKVGFFYPHQRRLELPLPHYSLTDEEVNNIRKLLSDSNVLEWQDVNEHGDPDMLKLMGGEGYNWSLYIEYMDGTASYKYGKGTTTAVQPNGYDLLVDGFTQFAEKKNQEYKATEN